MSETKKYTFVLSDGSKTNSKGFRIDLSGLDIERFRANPVMLYDHDMERVIGCWENIRVESNKLMADAVFDLDDPAAAEIGRKVDKGFLRGTSAGIIPFKLEQIADEYVMTASELLEGSITPIPADAGAVRLYNEKREVIAFEQLRLSAINNQNKIQMENTITLTAATRQSLGLSDAHTPKQIELAVQEKDDRIDRLEKEIKALRKSEVTTYLSQAVKDGKIDTKEVPGYEALSDTSAGFSHVRAIIDAKPVAASTSLKEMEKKTNLTGGDRAGWDYLKWMKEDPNGLQKLRYDDPSEFDRLQTEFQTKK